MIQKTKKLIRALQLKKYRKQEQCFVVEGEKSVTELLGSDFDIVVVAATARFLDRNEKAIRRAKVATDPSSEDDLAEAGSMQSNDAAIAIARMKANAAPTINGNEFVVALDDIRDPGNVGAIIRTADWYGIKKIIASEETADLYNSKTISATMGSFCRVSVFYTSLPAFLSATPHKKFGAFLEGEDVHAINFGKGGVIVIGNESNGISRAVQESINVKITIPRYGDAESLNAAIATAVILDNIKR